MACPSQTAYVWTGGPVTAWVNGFGTRAAGGVRAEFAAGGHEPATGAKVSARGWPQRAATRS
jgi:hypothetical protein